MLVSREVDRRRHSVWFPMASSRPYSQPCRQPGLMPLTGTGWRVEKGHTQLCPLALQRETLLRQLETNQLDIDATLEELSVQQETEDQNYSMYVSQHLQLCRP